MHPLARTALLMVFLLGALIPPPALSADVAAALDIAPGSLEAAIRKVAQERNLQVLYAPEDLKGLSTPGLRGHFTSRQALEELLKGTSLTVSSDRDIVFAIKPGGNPANPIHLAQAAAPDARASEAPRTRVEVTGSRLYSPDSEERAPVIVFDRARLDQLGVSSVADVFNHLTQQPFSTGDQFNFGGSRYVQLRGLGIGTTLVLVNGRRTITSGAQAARNAFDVSTIPLGIVERIEVLSDSASAIYGADAVGGVVNIILKGNVDRPAIELYYGSADGGADEWRTSLALGHQAGRLRASLVLDAFDRDFLLGTERDLFANQDFRRFGGADQRSQSSNPGNVTSTTTANLPGLPSRFAGVPVGSSGVGLRPSDFLATAGTRNLESLSRYRAVVPESRRYGAVGNVEWAFSPALTAFGTLFYSDRKETQLVTPPAVTGTVPAANPFNPFGVPVSVTWLFDAMGGRQTVTTDRATRVDLGLRGGAQGWDWEASVLANTDRGDNTTIGSLNAVRVTAALAATDPARALNVFQDGPGGSSELLESLLAAPVLDTFESNAYQVGGFARGTLLALPAGGLDAVFGAEARREELVVNLVSGNIIMKVDRDVWAGYTELRFPLMRDAAMARRLTFTVAGRYDHYSDFGGTFNPQYGLEWVPTPPLLLRASYGTSYRAPALFELYQPITPFSGLAVTDPRRNNQVTTVTLITGGNPDLQPEESKSAIVGFVFSPAGPGNWRVDGNLWRIKQNVRILRPDQVAVVANENYFPGRVIRATPTPADVAAGLPGTIQTLVLTGLNAGSLDTSGIDARVSAAFDTPAGRFLPSVALTWVKTYDAASYPVLPVVDRVGVADSAGSIPEWRGTATLGWERGGLGLSIAGRYTSSYKDVNSLRVQTGRTVGSQFLVDVQGSVRMGKVFGSRGLLRDVTLRVGAQNVFDEDPQFSEVANLGYDPSTADVRQRFIYLQLSKTF